MGSSAEPVFIEPQHSYNILVTYTNFTYVQIDTWTNYLYYPHIYTYTNVHKQRSVGPGRPSFKFVQLQ